MKVKFEELEDAFDFISFGIYGDHTALLNKSTGKIHMHSEYEDADEISEEMWESENTIEIPHKKDLGLGNKLVFEFVLTNSPDDYNYIRSIFGGPGAYARYKEFLESKSLLQSWYDYESAEQKRALREWCENNNIELTG